jgi:hypothetical protein
MSNIVYGLYRVEKYEGSFLVDAFRSRKSALKEGLRIKRDTVQDSLHYYRILGESAAEFCYRHEFDNVSFEVHPIEIKD